MSGYRWRDEQRRVESTARGVVTTPPTSERRRSGQANQARTRLDGCQSHCTEGHEDLSVAQETRRRAVVPLCQRNRQDSRTVPQPSLGRPGDRPRSAWTRPRRHGNTTVLYQRSGLRLQRQTVCVFTKLENAVMFS